MTNRRRDRDAKLAAGWMVLEARSDGSVVESCWYIDDRGNTRRVDKVSAWPSWAAWFVAAVGKWRAVDAARTVHVRRKEAERCKGGGRFMTVAQWEARSMTRRRKDDGRYNRPIKIF